MLRNVVESA